MPLFLATVSQAFVLDCIDGDDPVVGEVLYFCEQRGYRLAITPFVGVLLLDRYNQTSDPEIARAIGDVISKRHQIAYPTLDPVNRQLEKIDERAELANSIANELIGTLGLQTPVGYGVANVIAESAVMEAKYVILEDEDFVGLQLEKAYQVLKNYNLNNLKIVSRLFFYGLASSQQG